MKKSVGVIVFLIMGAWIPPAMAYIDPGSGSAIMSAIIGLFVAIGLAIKTYWYKLKSMFSKSKPSDSDEDTSEQAPESQD